jgi:glutathione synthase/RimK-type ligase-like ATP-grasp enzyme
VTALQVALATAEHLPAGSADAEGLISSFNELSIYCSVAVWSDYTIDWTRFDAVIMHTPWDYTFRLDDFRQWITELAGKTYLVNSRFFAWNHNKSYLLELADNDVDIPRSIILESGGHSDATQLKNALGEGSLVVKPAVGAGGRKAFKCEDAETASRLLHDSELTAGAVLVQRYEPSIINGEYSTIVIRGTVSHTVRKSARPGEFRVQDHYGGTVARVATPTGAHELAERLQTYLPERPLYARVDYVMRDSGRLILMEVELIEPDLFLRYFTPSFSSLANALSNQLRAKR